MSALHTQQSAAARIPIPPAPNDSASAWYAVRVRPRHERAVDAALRARGVESFLPTHCVRRVWSDRVKTLREPLFPGYLFCRLDRLRRRGVVEVPGVVQIVGFGGSPTPIGDEELDAIRALSSSGAKLTPLKAWKPGRLVRVVEGALAGVTGVLDQVRGGARLIVRVSLLQRAVAVEIDAAWVRPIETRRGAAR